MIIWPWPVTLTYGQCHPHLGHWMRLMGYTLVPSMKSVTEIASGIWPVDSFFVNFGANLTLTFHLDLPSLPLTLGSGMRLNGLYVGTKYEVCRWNRIRDIANCLVICSLLINLTDLWPRPSAKVISTWVIEYTLLGCTLVTSMKSVGWNSIQLLSNLSILGKFLPWPLTLTEGQGHRHLGHWTCLFGLYLGIKYEV